MGYSSARYDRSGSDQRPWKVHPIWRGIGCILLIVVPILSFFLARFFMQNVKWLAMPLALLRPVVISYTGNVPIDNIIFQMNGFLGGRLSYGDLFFTVIFMVLGFGVLSIFYGIIYRLIGPPRYGPLDSPPAKRIRHRG
jgi:hypothetical protein